MVDTILAVSVLGAIMILGFFGNYIFNRTQIPSIIWLLIFGLIVGYIFNIRNIDQSLIMSFSKFFAAVAIVIILFDGGINSDLYQLFRGAPRGFLLAMSAFFLSVFFTMIVIVALFTILVSSITLGDSIIIGIIMGAIVGGTSSPIVIPLVNKLENLQERTKMALCIESIITDPLCIVVVLAAFYSAVGAGAEGINLGIGVKNVVTTFSVGAVMGLIFGLAWLPIMHRIRKEQFCYVATLAIVFLIYSFTALLVTIEDGGEGAGAIACLVFGLVLGNGKKILNMFDYHGTKFELDYESKHSHSLISFIIRTFFFVFLGMMVGFRKIEFILIGLVILCLLVLVRFLAIKISTYKGGFDKEDKNTMMVMFPRGLAAAILALNFGPDIVVNIMPGMNGFFEDITFVIILGTTIICTCGISFLSYRKKQRLKTIETHIDKNQHQID